MIIILLIILLTHHFFHLNRFCDYAFSLSLLLVVYMHNIRKSNILMFKLDELIHDD